jgi:diacylglycerol kinase (ATP)
VISEVRKVLFIVNKFAGGGYQPELEGRIIKACSVRNIEAQIEFTKAPHHAISLARTASSSDVDLIVAAGGDGTINEVAQGLIGGGKTMGILPRGSGNGLARHLGIPLSLPDSLNTLFGGEVLHMDTFTLNGKLSLNVSGMGFDGHIANLFGGKTKRGLTGYAKLTLSEFLGFHEFDLTLSIDGSKLERKCFVLAIANSSQYGNNACIAPAALVSDGILHVNILRKIPLYRFDFVYAFFAKTIDQSRYSEIQQARNFTVETSTEIPYHVDGEPCGTATRFEIVMQPSTLPVIVPVKSGGRRIL